MTKINIPPYAANVIAALEKAGFEAFAVGGCVRDSLLGRTPNDWDVTTSARPDVVISLFKEQDGYFAIPTGLVHGTVTVVSDGVQVEVTTYRIDGEYSDSRRPDSVEFCDDITEDLARRDFTVNAMAYSHTRGLVDPFGGREDLCNRVLRCVGAPEKRFSEDALRILRAVRFAAVLDFAVEQNTAACVHGLKDALSYVAGERIGAELGKLLVAKGAARVIGEFPDVLCKILPGAVLNGTVTDSVRRLVGADVSLMLAALLSDTPAEHIRPALRGCRFDNKTSSRTVNIIAGLDAELKTKFDVKRLCRDFGTETAGSIVALRDARGNSESQAKAWLDEIVAGGECVSLASLAIKGDTLISMGIKPREIGAVLEGLLGDVMYGRIENCRDELIAAVKEKKYTGMEKRK